MLNCVDFDDHFDDDFDDDYDDYFDDDFDDDDDDDFDDDAEEGDDDDGGGFEMLQARGVSLALWRLVIPIQTPPLDPA